MSNKCQLIPESEQTSIDSLPDTTFLHIITCSQTASHQGKSHFCIKEGLAFAIYNYEDILVNEGSMQSFCRSGRLSSEIHAVKLGYSIARKYTTEHMFFHCNNITIVELMRELQGSNLVMIDAFEPAEKPQSASFHMILAHKQQFKHVKKLAEDALDGHIVTPTQDYRSGRNKLNVIIGQYNASRP